MLIKEDFLKGFKSLGLNQTSIGNAVVKCMNVRELVDFAVNWIEKNRKPN